jgi:hypothetical protein
MDIRFLKGKSVSLTIVFNAEYNYANIQDVIVKLKDDTIAKKSNNTLLSTSNPRVFRVELTSEYTNALGSLSKLQVFLDDSSLGVFPFEEINVYADASLGFANTSINEGSDFTINLTVNLLNPNLDIETVEIYNTFSSQALALKANIASPTFTGTVSGITATMVGLGNVNNTSDASKPISTAQQTALDLKSNLASPTFTGKIITPDILVSNLTASQLVATDANDNLVSLATATYPSLTELSYVKGVTSALQTQLGAKANLASPTFTGTVNMATLTTSGAINGLPLGLGGGSVSTNTAIGSSAGNGNTTGDSNIFLGFFSGLGNTTGNFNTYIGVGAGRFSTNGSNNTYLGYYAGRFIADGTTSNILVNNSTFIGNGTRALADNQTNQIVIGHNAIGLGSNTTVLGNSSTSFGRWWGNLLLGSSTNSGEALQVTGTTKLAGNTAVTGTLSVSSTINGLTVGFGGGNISSNTIIGTFNGLQNTTGNNNTTIGAAANFLNTTGAKNTFIGAAAGRDNTIGANNIFIGESSGRFISGGTVSNNNSNNTTLIGVGTSPLADNQTNQTVIGYNAVGLGSNTTVLGNSSTVTTGLWGDIRLVKGMATAPASATATGTVGDIRITSTAIYVCTATNTWKKSDLLTFI